MKVAQAPSIVNRRLETEPCHNKPGLEPYNKRSRRPISHCFRGGCIPEIRKTSHPITNKSQHNPSLYIKKIQGSFFSNRISSMWWYYFHFT